MFSKKSHNKNEQTDAYSHEEELYKSSYSKSEFETLIRTMERVFYGVYFNRVDLSKDIDLLSLHSRYNLKFIEQQKNSQTLTWACSCISKKSSKRREISKFDSDEKHSESEDCWEEEFVKDKVKKVKRNVKRTNAGACNFRLKFLYSDGVYSLSPKSKKSHNHAPEHCSSSKSFSSKSRNIKFTLKEVLLILEEITSELDTFGIIDSLLVSNLKKKLLDLRGQCLDKTFKTNYKKKVKPLIEFIYNEILRLSEARRADKSFFYPLLLNILIERGGNYFAHDTLQILKNARESRDQIDCKGTLSELFENMSEEY